MWTETNSKGPWRFHPVFGPTIWVLGLTIVATPSGFLAGSATASRSAVEGHPVVLTSSTGMRWTKHVLSARVGDVQAVGTIGSRLVAVGSRGKTATRGSVWTSSGSRWALTKAGNTFPATVAEIADTGGGLVVIPREAASPLYFSADGTHWSPLKRPTRVQRTEVQIVAATAWRNGVAAFFQPVRFHPGVRFWVATLSG